MGSLDPSASSFIPSNQKDPDTAAADNHQLVGLETDNPPSGSLPLNEVSSPYSPPVCWGWLEPSAPNLPYIMLRGHHVAIGRGHDIFEGLHSSSAPSLMVSPDTSSEAEASAQPSNESSGIQEPSDTAQEQSLFVYIADGRVSRRHCLLTQGTATEEGAVTEEGTPLAEQRIVFLEDFSTNGTFLKGTKLPQGQSMAVKDGDRISIVLSVAPLVEQAFTYHAGHPLAHMLAVPPPSQWIGWVGPALTGTGASESSTTKVLTERAGAVGAAGTLAAAPAGEDTFTSSPMSSADSSPPVRLIQDTEGALRRSATTTYCTAEAALAEPSLMHCQICMEPFRRAVALEPCGHAFCAICLSHHLETRMKDGQNLSCPLRCEAPQRVVAATLIRELAAQIAASEPGVTAAGAKTGGEEEDKGDHGMFDISLEDSELPLELGPLQLEQALHTLSTILRDLIHPSDAIPESGLAENDDKDRVVQALRLIDRLARSDEDAWNVVGSQATGGIGNILNAMKFFIQFEDVQCVGCMALMAYLSVDDYSQVIGEMITNKVVETLLNTMRAHSSHAFVQEAALMCLKHLSFQEPSLEESICREGLKDILRALRTHKNEEDVVTRALRCLISLARSKTDAAERAAAEMVAAGVPRDIARVLRQYGGKNESMLWSAIHIMHLLVRDRGIGSKARVARAMEVGSAGVLGPLRVALEEYRNLAEETGDPVDQDYIELGTDLISLLEDVMRLVKLRRLRLLYWIVVATAVASLGIVISWGIRATEVG